MILDSPALAAGLLGYRGGKMQKMKKNLHIPNICCIFAHNFSGYGRAQRNTII